jgi:hypothetical protein
MAAPLFKVVAHDRANGGRLNAAGIMLKTLWYFSEDFLRCCYAEFDCF